MKKNIMLILLILSLSNIMFSYEDDYKKIYTVTISKEELFKEIGATKKQQKKLSEIFEKYQLEADKIDSKLIRFEEKKEKIGEIELKRYNEIKKVLSNSQLELFNKYTNNEKSLFNEKIDNITNLVDNLNLTNEQKSQVLKFERDFKREVRKIDSKNITTEAFSREYEKLRSIRNEKIRNVLTEEQQKVLFEELK